MGTMGTVSRGTQWAVSRGTSGTVSRLPFKTGAEIMRSTPWLGKECTYNGIKCVLVWGKPEYPSGRRWPTVVSQDIKDGICVEYSESAVVNVMSHGGNFRG